MSKGPPSTPAASESFAPSPHSRAAPGQAPTGLLLRFSYSAICPPLAPTLGAEISLQGPGRGTAAQCRHSSDPCSARQGLQQVLWGYRGVGGGGLPMGEWWGGLTRGSRPPNGIAQHAAEPSDQVLLSRIQSAN